MIIADMVNLCRWADEQPGGIVLAHGCFDGLHPGHIYHLEQAKSYGATLLVSVTHDRHVNKGPGRPFFPHRHRVYALSQLRSVDHVYLSQMPDAAEVIGAVRPAVYVKGEEYADASTPALERERAVLASVGGVLRFTPAHIEYHSSEVYDAARIPDWKERRHRGRRAAECG